MNKIAVFLLAIILFSCHHIQKGSDLNATEIAQLKKFGILDSGEQIIKFYSQGEVKSDGNFFTNKRLASYWHDERRAKKNKTFSVFYKDIKSIDTVYNPGLTFAPYMRVNTFNGKRFKVCVEGGKAELKQFFEEALQQWQKNK